MPYLSSRPRPPRIALAALACALSGALATAQTPPMAWSVGYTTCQLRPHSGSDQRLNGFALGGEYRLAKVWSLEATFSHQTGTEAGSVNLRQTSLMAGPRYALALGNRWRGLAHLLVGREQLQAGQGSDADQVTSFAYGPGVALDFQVNHHLALRGQEDLVCTHYAGVNQRSPSLFLGLVLR